MSAFVYILRSSDGSFYVGSTRADLDARVAERQQGTFPDSYTFMRRPVELVWSEHFDIITDAVAAERKIKGWSRAKKEALCRGDWKSVRRLAKRTGVRDGE